MTVKTLSVEKLQEIYDIMVQARVLEERLITMPKQHHGYFWIGGPGEEAFNVALGLQVKKGQGIHYDYLHLHYRSSAILLAMGVEPISFLRQMKNTATDPHSGGRNFANHCSVPELNITPITSTIETQYLTALGTAMAQRQNKTDSITLVNGGDAGSAEGDFASSLIWSTRPGQELPILMIVTNNAWGISTSYSTQHGEEHVSDRAKAFGMKTAVVDGNDLEASYAAIAEAMHYVRTERKPFMLEAKVSRLYGHSSASGAVFNAQDPDPIKLLEQGRLGLSEQERADVRKHHEQLIREQFETVIHEPQPSADSIYDYTYSQQKGKYW